VDVKFAPLDNLFNIVIDRVIDDVVLIGQRVIGPVVTDDADVFGNPDAQLGEEPFGAAGGADLGEKDSGDVVESPFDPLGQDFVEVVRRIIVPVIEFQKLAMRVPVALLHLRQKADGAVAGVVEIQGRSHHHPGVSVEVEMPRRDPPARNIVGIDRDVSAAAAQQVDVHGVGVERFSVLQGFLIRFVAPDDHQCVGDGVFEPGAILLKLGDDAVEGAVRQILHQGDDDARREVGRPEIEDHILLRFASGRKKSVLVERLDDAPAGVFLDLRGVGHHPINGFDAQAEFPGHLSAIGLSVHWSLPK